MDNRKPIRLLAQVLARTKRTASILRASVVNRLSIVSERRPVYRLA